MTSWKLVCTLRSSMRVRSASAKAALFSASRFVVGSSSARMPQCRQKVSASANRMRRQARTCKQAGRQRGLQSLKFKPLTTFAVVICVHSSAYLSPNALTQSQPAHELMSVSALTQLKNKSPRKTITSGGQHCRQSAPQHGEYHAFVESRLSLSTNYFVTFMPMNECARTFCPAEQRPRMSSSALPVCMTTR